MRGALLSAAIAAALLVPAGAAHADFDLQRFDVSFTEAPAAGSEVAGAAVQPPARGALVTQAGAHPYAVNVDIGVNTVSGEDETLLPDGSVKDLEVEQVPGFAGNPTAVPPCSSLELFHAFPRQRQLSALRRQLRDRSRPLRCRHRRRPRPLQVAAL